MLTPYIAGFEAAVAEIFEKSAAAVAPLTRALPSIGKGLSRPIPYVTRAGTVFVDPELYAGLSGSAARRTLFREALRQVAAPQKPVPFWQRIFG